MNISTFGLFLTHRSGPIQLAMWAYYALLNSNLLGLSLSSFWENIHYIVSITCLDTSYYLIWCMWHWDLSTFWVPAIAGVETFLRLWQLPALSVLFSTHGNCLER